MLVTWPVIDRSLGGDQYLFLARNFLHGRITIDDLPRGYGDYVEWNGHKYLPFGPVPAVLLVPFLPLLERGMPIAISGYILTMASVWMLYKILILAGFDKEKCRWLTLFYFAGTPYLGVLLVGISTYFAHVTATMFVLAAILALFRRSWFIAGLCLGVAAGARMTELFAAPFFIWIVHAGVTTRIEKGAVRDAIVFVFGLLTPVAILAAYNFARFGNPMETGFGLAELYTGTLEAARAKGLFSIAHVPKNLYYMLVAGPLPFGGSDAASLRLPFVQPSQWGMSLFLTSPALIYAFRSPWRESVTRACWLGIGVTLLPVVAYYGIGYVQFGYRYALDFMPFAVLLAAYGMRAPLTTMSRVLMSTSVAICIWGAVWLAVWI
jgi:hypothetical protein